MMSRSKSLSALAAVLAAGVTLGAFISPAMCFHVVGNGMSNSGLATHSMDVNGVSLNRMPFDFSTVAVEDVQFPAGSK
jgi:hypothetical protein